MSITPAAPPQHSFPKKDPQSHSIRHSETETRHSREETDHSLKEKQVYMRRTRGLKRQGERERCRQSGGTKRYIITHPEKNEDRGGRQRPLKGKEILSSEEMGRNRPRDSNGEGSEIKERRHFWWLTEIKI